MRWILSADCRALVVSPFDEKKSPLNISCDIDSHYTHTTFRHKPSSVWWKGRTFNQGRTFLIVMNISAAKCKITANSTPEGSPTHCGGTGLHAYHQTTPTEGQFTAAQRARRFSYNCYSDSSRAQPTDVASSCSSGSSIHATPT